MHGREIRQRIGNQDIEFAADGFERVTMLVSNFPGFLRQSPEPFRLDSGGLG